MKEFLTRIKLVLNFSTELEIRKTEFVQKLRDSVDEGSTSFFMESFDIFSSSKNEYKGMVNDDGFKIKRKRKLFDVGSSMAIAKGAYYQNGNKLIIKTEVKGFHGMMIPFYIFFSLFYIAFFISFFTLGETGGYGSGLMIIFLILHASFMMGLPYFIMRRSTNRLKHELEREFFYLTK